MSKVKKVFIGTANEGMTSLNIRVSVSGIVEFILPTFKNTVKKALKCLPKNKYSVLPVSVFAVQGNVIFEQQIQVSRDNGALEYLNNWMTPEIRKSLYNAGFRLRF